MDQQNKPDFFTLLGEIVINLISNGIKFISFLGSLLKVAVLRAYKGLGSRQIPQQRGKPTQALENPLAVEKSSPAAGGNSVARVQEELTRRRLSMYPDMLVDYKNWRVTDPRLLVPNPRMQVVIPTPIEGGVITNPNEVPNKPTKVETMNLAEFLKSKGIIYDPKD